MNSLRRFFAVAVWSAFLLLVWTEAGQAGEPPDKGKAPRPVTVTVLFTPVGKPGYSATVPRAAEGFASMPIPVSESGRWIVAISRGERTFHVDATDPMVWFPGGKDNGPSPMTVFAGDFEIVYGKPITVLRTSAYTLEVTLTEE